MNKKAWPRITRTENHGKGVFVVDARIAGKGERKFFSTKSVAEGFALACRIRRTNEGQSVFDDRELATHGWTVQQAIRFAIEHLRKQKGSVLFSDAIKRLEASKLASEKTPYYCRLMRQRLEKLETHFEGRKIGAIMAPDIESFLNDLTVAPATRNTIRRDLVTLWSFAVKSGWARENEAKKVDSAQVVSSPPPIFTPEQAAALLTASSADVLAFHAIGFFAGLRVAEIKRLDWRDVDLESGFIHISAENSKTRTRRLVPILDNLRAWLTPIAKASGKIIKPNFAKRQLAARNKAGFKPETAKQKEKGITLLLWPENGLRHSFVSYRLTATANPSQTALESGHDQAVMFAHYRELVKPKEAERYFSIRPVGKGKGKVVAMAA